MGERVTWCTSVLSCYYFLNTKHFATVNKDRCITLNKKMLMCSCFNKCWRKRLLKWPDQPQRCNRSNETSWTVKPSSVVFSRILPCARILKLFFGYLLIFSTVSGILNIFPSINFSHYLILPLFSEPYILSFPRYLLFSSYCLIYRRNYKLDITLFPWLSHFSSYSARREDVFSQYTSGFTAISVWVSKSNWLQLHQPYAPLLAERTRAFFNQSGRPKPKP